MNAKPFDLGITVGRFQTLHTGHVYMIEKAIAVCERVGIFVGSSQESGTFKNPYTYEQRERFLREVFGDKVEIYPLPDIGVGNNSTWGDYVLENVRKRFGKSPDLLVSGKEERRVSWFDSVEGACVAELYVPKIIDISATEMRSFLVEDDFESWKKYTNSALWKDYAALRAAVLASKDMKLQPIVVSLLDTDLYKFNMDQVIFHKHTDLCGQYYFKCRNKDVVFTPEMEEEINAQIDHLCTLTFTKEELDYLRSIRFIKNDYVEFLRLWRPIRDYVTVSRDENGELQIVVDGPLFSAMQFEIFLLEIVNEVYFRMKYDYETLRKSAEEKLDKKIKALKVVGGRGCPPACSGNRQVRRYLKRVSRNEVQPHPDRHLCA